MKSLKSKNQCFTISSQSHHFHPPPTYFLFGIIQTNLCATKRVFYTVNFHTKKSYYANKNAQLMKFRNNNSDLKFH